MSKKELSTTDKTVTILVLIFAIIPLLVFLGLKKIDWFRKPAPLVNTALSAEREHKIKTLQKEISDGKLEQSELEQKLELAHKNIQALRSTESSVDEANNITPKTSEDYNSLYKENQTFAQNAVKYDVEKTTLLTSIQTLESQKRILEEKNTHLVHPDTNKAKLNELNTLITQLKDEQATDKEQLVTLQKKLSNLTTEKTELNTQFNSFKLKTEATEVKLNRKNQILIDTIKRLKGNLGNFQAQAAFTTDSEKLSINLKKLFSKLDTKNDTSREQQETLYSNLNSTVGATQLTRIKFATGKMEMNQEGINKIKNALKNLDSNDEILVVGYASQQGDKATNESLSSKRAKTVTSKVISNLQYDNKIQSVYLGETARFGPLLENQCVEVWKVTGN